MRHFKNCPATSGNRFAPPYSNNLIAKAFLLPLFFSLTLLRDLPAQTCTCSSGSGINLSGTSISLDGLVMAGTLPANSYNGPCISVPANATLTIDIPYEFSGTTFNMGANSQITVAAPNKLIISGNCVLKGCNALWHGIVVAPETLNPLAIPGGRLDMSESTLRDAETGIFAQNQAKIRLVDNTFINNYISLRITGFVPFINFGNSSDFSGNFFTADSAYIPPSYDLATAPLTAIHFTNATTFFIGQDFANPPTVVNFILKVRRGIMADNSNGLGFYGVQISDLTGTVGIFNQTDRVAIRINNSRNINVKYCNMFGTSSQGRPWYGILTFGNSTHKQIYHDNTIISAFKGIFITDLPFPATEIDMQNNYIVANLNCIEAQNFANGAGNRFFLNKNLLFPRFFAGFSLRSISAPYGIYDNTVTSSASQTASGFIFQCTGRGDVFSNEINMATPYAVFAFSIGQSNNCKIHENTFYGNAANADGLFDGGINTANCTNVIYCCNAVDNTTYGTQFNFANSNTRFYTTQYGVHDTALYFPPAATLNSQFNTGNMWANATTTIDAYYDGDVATAIFNAPFRTNAANITATKIEPAGWFQLFGTDPSCSIEPSFSCDSLNLPTNFTEITAEDYAALAPVDAGNEYALRFEQKRQLYRKLKENPALTNWDTDISDFYNDASNNTIGAVFEIDEAWRNLFTISAALRQNYEPLAEQLSDLNVQVTDILAEYPSASAGEQVDLLTQLHDLTDEISEVQADLDDLSVQAQSEYDDRLDDLLALNNTLNATENWEIAEKDINGLFFRYCGGLIQTFTSGQQDQIETIAEACPQYYGPGVYKARYLLQEITGTERHYFENQCVPEERSDKKLVRSSAFTILPNPASDRALVRLPEQVFQTGGSITLRSADGRVILAREYLPGTREYALDLIKTLPGVYWLTVQAENLAALTAKLIIIR